MKPILFNKPKKQTASEIITLRVTKEDKDLFQQTAKELRVSMSTLMIEVLKLQIQLSKEA